MPMLNERAEYTMASTATAAVAVGTAAASGAAAWASGAAAPLIQLYKPPDYFAVKIDDPDTFRFYKWNDAENDMKCCKPTPGEIVFVENIERRVMKISRTHNVNTTRLGFVYFANGKAYPVYKFEYSPLLRIKKHGNEFTLPPSIFNYNAIKQKMRNLGPWPITSGTWSVPASWSVTGAQQQQQPQPPANTTVKRPNLPPSYVCELLIADAVNKNETCPIIYEPLTRENAVVTSCFHVFSRAAFLEWKKKSAECPACRAICSVTA